MNIRTGGKRFLWIVGSAPFLYFLVIFLYGWWTDWRPEEIQPIEVRKAGNTSPVADTVLTLITWNVGFGGNGAESDFFFDDEGMWYSGSSMVRTPRKLVEKNFNATLDFLAESKADFYLLQEVDLRSDRSYRIPQFDGYCETLKNYAAGYAPNYRCPRVPIPLLEPWNAYGAVESGLADFSIYQPSEAIRYQLPGQYPMPDRMFQLDRCIALYRYPTVLGPDLVVINVHNSAYDPGDRIKSIQLPYLRDIAMRAYEKGHYVVIGGDWNQCPPWFRFDMFMPGKTQGFIQGNIPADFFPEDWRFAYDPITPTNRKLRDPYQKGETFETLIDYFLVSPNVQILGVAGLQQAFSYSDHQPVRLQIRLKRPQ